MRSILLTILFMLLAFVAPTGVVRAQSISKIKSQLRQMRNPSQRIDSAMVWKERFANDENEKFLLMQILNDARLVNDKNREAYALRHLCRCSYNMFDPQSTTEYYLDSLSMYYEQFKRLNLSTKEYKHFDADIKSFLCYSMILTGRYSAVLELAEKMLQEDGDDDYSVITAYEMMGQAYQDVMQFDRATECACKAYKLSRKHKNQDKYTMHLGFLLCDLFILEGKDSLLLDYAKQMEEYVVKDEKEGYSPMGERNRALLHSYYVAYYLTTNQLDLAREHVEEAVKYNDNQDEYAKSVKSAVLSRYYLRVGDLVNAYAILQNGLSDEANNMIYHKQMVEVLTAMGDHEGALKSLKYVNDRVEQYYSNTYSLQLDEMQAKYDVYKLEQQKNDRDHVILVLVIVFTIFVIAILAYMNRRLIKAKKRVERANATQKSFLQNMSHEIRTPLNAICGFSQLVTSPEMRDFITAEEMTEYGNIIKSNTDMLTTLVNDILDASDMQSGKYRMNFADCSVNAICKNAINTVSYRCPEHIKLYMTSDVADDYMIHSDEQRAIQILINYLTNAIKHTAEGEIHVHCSLTENPGKVTFSVTDTGEGVPKDKAHLIFGRFEKLDTFKQGTGLGLAICRALAELMHGEVKLDTSYTEGARFVFIHPVK